MAPSQVAPALYSFVADLLRTKQIQHGDLALADMRWEPEVGLLRSPAVAPAPEAERKAANARAAGVMPTRPRAGWRAQPQFDDMFACFESGAGM